MNVSNKQQNNDSTEKLLPGKHAARLGALHPKGALSLISEQSILETNDSITFISPFFQNIAIYLVCSILSCRALGPTHAQQYSHPQITAAAATFLCLQ